MTEQGPRLAPFDPKTGAPAPPSTNGHRGRRRFRIGRGAMFGILIGAIAGSTMVGRVQWLNLGKVGWWGRPVLASVAAGLMVGALRRDEARTAVVTGALAALLSLWVVYGLVRISTPVLFVEESLPGRIARDLGMLAAVAIPSGAAGAAIAASVSRFGRVFRTRSRNTLPPST